MLGKRYAQKIQIPNLAKSELSYYMKLEKQQICIQGTNNLFQIIFRILHFHSRLKILTNMGLNYFF